MENMNIESVRDLYENPKTYLNVKSNLKRLNEVLSLTPANQVHLAHMEEQFHEMCATLLSNGYAKTKTELLNKLFTIVGVLNRLGHAKTKLSELLSDLKTDASRKLVDSPVAEHTARPWREMLPLFQEIISDGSYSQFAKVIAVCFKHGYVVRIQEIFNTGTSPNQKNYLNLKDRTWTITEHKNAAKMGERKFQVTQEFVTELLPFLKKQDFYLIFKSNYMPYETQLLSSVGITSFSVNEARNSYEQFNWRASGRTLKEKQYISEKILGHSEQVAKKFYTAHETETKILAAMVPPEPEDISDDGEAPAQAFLEDTSGKIGSSGKVRPRIKPRAPHP